ncbi:radical SAM/SPASM domain-containing protein [Parafrankia sp. EUN1f]|uniref:radical SAM/SPASM domain-containing protein n=1 Tax=Parafrankia sp. EUN1f TaxID=102897 RepID=UPI0001C4645B|nr:radical SAM/SPASM domain-containing protein [Parafrankia sp. EUN1f]EFC80891.1 Radical SAM domain protein [Parafrankia sp. EUN1f]
MPAAIAARVDAPQVPRTLSLEITYGCNLVCGHCYAESAPGLGHGTMSLGDWYALIDLAASVGVARVQLIGGEAALHPDLPALVRHALGANLGVEVYTNLTFVTDTLWEVYGLPGVSVATSYYSPEPAAHDQATGRRGSHAKTRANIVKAVELGLTLRVAVIETASEADAAAAEAELRVLGVTRVGRDRVRSFGRAAAGAPDPAGLCGHCGTTRAAILPDGKLVPCGMGRWLSGGNVRDTPLDQLLAGEQWRTALAAVPAPRAACKPDDDSCKPKLDGGDCPPAEQQACQPDWNRR